MFQIDDPDLSTVASSHLCSRPMVISRGSSVLAGEQARHRERASRVIRLFFVSPEIVNKTSTLRAGYSDEAAGNPAKWRRNGNNLRLVQDFCVVAWILALFTRC
ncbi:hypothetical protein [Bradyrhizobium sp. WSM1743]|uniref:hypothetical protein n=1 Tax=Bradyrhizobium sp. WSM1743 TaxID=318996 RepID=UPI0012EB3718|nr:hypothetical protein [Bradyrhizobium sp. WSM1743]